MTLRLRYIALILCALFAVSGCGTDDNYSGGPPVPIDNCASGTVAGAGSTFVQSLAQQWVKDYGAACRGATVNYQAVGSGAGIQQFLAGTIDFAGSDVPLTTNERDAARAKRQGAVEMPWSAGAIALEYNLPSIPDLQLSPSTIAKIFNGSIRRWNDAAIRADNPGVNPPNVAIQMIHRSDGSGTTQAFTAYLRATAPEDWTLGSGKEVDWPVGQGAKGSDGVTAAVRSTEGAISYAELSYAKANNLGTARVKNSSDNFVEPEPANASAALESAKVTPEGSVDLSYVTTNPNAYPITTVTYLIVPQAQNDAGETALLRSFAGYALSGGQLSAEALLYAPLPANIREAAMTKLQTVGNG